MLDSWFYRCFSVARLEENLTRAKNSMWNIFPKDLCLPLFARFRFQSVRPCFVSVYLTSGVDTPIIPITLSLGLCLTLSLYSCNSIPSSTANSRQPTVGSFCITAFAAAGQDGPTILRIAPLFLEKDSWPYKHFGRVSLYVRLVRTHSLSS